MPTSTLPAVRVHRIEVHPRPGEPDAMAGQFAEQVRQTFGHAAGMHSSRVFLIEAPLEEPTVQRIADELLADPVNQRAVVGASDRPEHGVTIEVHYLPGVMDPVAQSTREAIVDMLADETGLGVDDVQVRTGFRYDIAGTDAPTDVVRRFAQRALANTVIQAIHDQPFHPEQFPQAAPRPFELTHVPIRDLDEGGLATLSRQGHLFLSLAEMQAIQQYYRQAGREPTDAELETLAQTWSEHCVHKTLKATIRYREQSAADSEPAAPSPSLNMADRPGHERNADGSVTIHNLLKSTIAAATFKLMDDGLDAWCVSVFEDNAGIVRFDDDDAVCIKVETHNHPSAIEPYGGAATGIGGCIRDVMGTGLSARPIANTDVFCVAGPTPAADPPKGVIPPRRILQQVVAGVRDYGNRMGIPTVNGAVWFHDDYVANPLVFCGCVGIIPLDKCFGEAQSGDRIIVLGGRTGRDGIHGATFSSAELTDTHADEFAHAVQIGNAITQKKMMDVILEARGDKKGTSPLFHAVTDCGAGGFSSAVGEMGQRTGARVTLETAPLKYAGLTPTEIWISEAQERMVLAVPPENVDRLRALCNAQDVAMCDLGQFGWHADGPGQGEPTLLLTWHDQEVGQLSMNLLHDGIPMPTRDAVWRRVPSPKSKVQSLGESQVQSLGESHVQSPTSKVIGNDARGASSSTLDLGLGTWDSASATLDSSLKAMLSHPNIASKHWIIRQYDHEVQGGSVVKPLVGPHQDGPGDAAVLRPKLTSNRGIALGCGLAPNLSEKATANGWASDGDSYAAALAAIDEAVRNVICAGAQPSDSGGIAILDNFCWPRCDDPHQLGALVRAAEACYDGALAYRTPFVSGKDSLSNQFTTEDGRLITIPQTLLITALGIVPDVLRARTMDAKAAGNLLLIVGDTDQRMGGSHYVMSQSPRTDSPSAPPPSAIAGLSIPRVDLKAGPANARAVAQLIAEGLIASAHDCSDGGLLVAAAEMAFTGRIGLDLDLAALPTPRLLDPLVACFAETPSRYLIEVAPRRFDRAVRLLRLAAVPFGHVGAFADHDRLTLRTQRDGRILDVPLDELRHAWQAPLDW